MRLTLDAGKNHLAIACPPLGGLVSGIAAMAPRAYWNGYLRLSLVSCPVQLFPAISEREKIRFHQINRIDGLTVSGYAALYALALNFAVSIVLSPLLNCVPPREARTKPLPAITGSMSLESVGSPAR
jgi:hypothetical protein